jgi:hypothetical protein
VIGTWQCTVLGFFGQKCVLEDAMPADFKLVGMGSNDMPMPADSKLVGM